MKTKFAIIRGKITIEKDIKDFSKRYTASKFLKQFKCKNVVELKAHDELRTCGNISKIDANTLSDLTMKLVHAHRDVFPKASLGRRNNIKFFMFSDDAESSAFAFDELLDNIDIMRFTLNTFDTKELIKNLDISDDVRKTLSTIEDMEGMISTLENLGDEVNISIIDSYGEEKVAQLKEKAEEKYEDAIQEIENILTSGWEEE